MVLKTYFHVALGCSDKMSNRMYRWAGLRKYDKNLSQAFSSKNSYPFSYHLSAKWALDQDIEMPALLANAQMPAIHQQNALGVLFTNDTNSILSVFFHALDCHFLGLDNSFQRTLHLLF